MPAVDTYFNIVVKKYWLGIGGPFWVNTYEVGSTIGEITASTVVDTGITEAIVAFERALHVSQVYFDSVMVSTGENDVDPYDPTSFQSVPYGVFGLRSGAGDRIDLNGVYKVRRQAPFGRNGKLQFRGVLVEDDVTGAAQGFWDMAPGGELSPTGTVWLGAKDELGDWFGGSSDVGLVMKPGVSEPYNALNIPRFIVDFFPMGAGFSRFNHRYYDVP